jgi:hypothetical protein
VSIAPAHPKRQPPAIQIDTLTETSNRTALFEKNKLILLWSLRPQSAFVEKSARIEIVMKTQHFRNGSLVSLNI